MKQFDIKGHRSLLKQFEIGDEKEARGDRTGVEVAISNIETNFPSLLDANAAAEELSKRLALYLRKYPGIEITYDGLKVDPSDLESNCETYDIQLKDKDDELIIGSALNGGVELFVTGDKEVLKLKSVDQMMIVDPRSFWALLKSHPMKLERRLRNSE